MLDRVVDFFLPRVGELLVDHVHENINDFNFTFDSLRGHLATLSAKTSEIDNQIQIAELSGKRKRKREVEEWLAAVKSIETEFSQLENEVGSQGFIRRFFGGGKAAQLNQSVGGLILQSRHFSDLLPLLTTRLIGNTFKENLERIWRLLSIESVSSLGIQGMGGVGKTTLAKHINDRLLEQSEENVIWVTVSQSFTIKKLQDDIARAAGVDLSNEENVEKRAARLWRVLSRRKNILLLDDVWENINLEKVGYPLSEEGFRLVITTRSVEVCRRIGCKEVFVVKTLPKDEAWKLFSETLGHETRLAPQVEEIAKCIAEMCGGLPLGIVVMAGSMKGETAVHVWRNALEELKEYSVMGREDMEDEVFKVLQHNFDRLNPTRVKQGQSWNVEQLCLLYCSLYPEDYQLHKEELVGKFISKGLMDEMKGRRKQFDKGHCILDKLVSVCLLESSGHRNEKVKMHVLVRYMALKITEGTTMVIAGHKSLKEIPNEEEWTKDLETVSLMMNGIEEIPSGMSPNCPKLSTLLFSGNPLEFIPDSFFLQMHGLCTLDLSGTNIERLPDSLSSLEGLKVLTVRNCRRLVYVPYLGNLKALRELDLSTIAIKELPRGIEELVDLRFLSIDAKDLEMFPRGLFLRFPNLQCLILPDHLEAPMGEIERLKQLEEFRGNVKNVYDANGFIRCRTDDIVYDINVGSAYFNILDQPKQVKYDHRLRFSNYNLKNREEAILGHNIEELLFIKCEGLSHILLDDFGRLIDNPKCLKRLGIEVCGGIECIMKLQSPISSTLEEIWLEGLGDLKSIIMMEEREIVVSPPSTQAVFSSLRKLEISDCHNMKRLGILKDLLQGFPVLEEIGVINCLEMEGIAEDGGEAHFVSLPKLRRLTLENLPRLKSLCNKTTLICPSIEEIQLVRCPGLKKFPLHIVPPPPSLTQIRMQEEQWASVEWEDPIHPLLLEPFLRYYYGIGGSSTKKSTLKEKGYSVMGLDDKEGEVFKIFDQLDPNNRRQSRNVEQLCFLYCSLYPKDYEISKEELVGKFISELLMVDQEKRRQQVDQGNFILDKLVDVRLLESCTDGGVKMNDLVRSMSLKITEGTTMVKAGHESLKEIPIEEQWTEDLEKVSLMMNGIEEVPPETSPNCPKLSTLLLSNNPLKFLPDSFFLRMHGLCTLALSHTGIEKLPDSLSALVSLKALLLRSCERLAHVPCLGNLKALTELDLSQTAIKELPSGIEELVRLKLLCINARYLDNIGSGLLLRFPDLQCLELPRHIEAPMEEIQNLEKVEEFGGRVKNVCDFNRFTISHAFDAALFGIQVGPDSTFHERNFDNGLTLHNYDFKNGEGKEEAILGDNIWRLSILRCEGLSNSLLDDVEGLLRIKCLEIEDCDGIECILKGDQLMEERQSQSFGTLEEIWLYRLGDLKGVMEKRETVASAPSELAVFRSLRKLVISSCYKMKKLGLPVSEFPTLEELSVSYCSEIEEIVEVGRGEGEGEACSVSLPKLKVLRLCSLPRLKSIVEVRKGEGEARFASLPELKWLELNSLPRLKSICNNGPALYDSIETIKLVRCRGLKKFPLDVVPPPPSLRRIDISKEEWASMEWEDPTLPLLLQPLVKFCN